MNSLPRVLNFFIIPRIEQVVELQVLGDAFRVSIIKCPCSRLQTENRRIGDALRKLCLKEGIDFVIPKNNNLYAENNIKYIERGLNIGTTGEIKAIKSLSALIKLSKDKNTNLLKKDIGFICERPEYDLIRTLSIEASSVLIYDHDKMDDRYKTEIFETLMEDKGISAVFSKNLGKIIKECEILYVDENIELAGFEADLPGKVVIGSNQVPPEAVGVKEVLLWYSELRDLSSVNPYVLYNDELLTVFRYFYKDRDIIRFLERLPYIYMSQV